MIPPNHILFFANNPGGLRALLPVKALLPNSKLVITAPLEEIMPTKPDHVIEVTASEDELKAILDTYSPHIVVTGTSMPASPGGQLENCLRRLARSKNITSMTILDHWSNYRERFLSQGHFHTGSLPDILCVMDERAKKEMIAEGFPEKILQITGQPAFDGLTQLYANLSTVREKARLTLGLGPDDKLIGFVSEPVKNDYGNLRGYTEETVLTDLIKQVLPAFPLSILGVKFHPREQADKFSHLEKTKERTLLLTQFSAEQLLAASDVIIGMTSSLLIQAHMLGLKTISYQPGAVLDSAHARLIQPVMVVNNTDLLVSEIQHAMNDVPSQKKEVSFTAAGPKVVTIIRQLQTQAQ